jgi:hypothetical protein
MNGLLLDTKGSHRATYKDVIKEVIPAPRQESQTYQPIQNIELLNMLDKVADSHGLELVNPTFGIDRKGQRMFGVYEVEGKNHLDNKVKLMLGVRNSFDMSCSAGVCFGSKVFVCSNLCFSGYADASGIAGMASHRHTLNIYSTLYDRLQESLHQVDKFKDYQEIFFGTLERKNIGNNGGYGLIIDAARNGVINKTKILEVANEWQLQHRGPANVIEEDRYHPEFAPRTAYSLFNAFTECSKAIQERNPVEANSRSIKLTEYFHSQFMN